MRPGPRVRRTHPPKMASSSRRHGDRRECRHGLRATRPGSPSAHRSPISFLHITALKLIEGTARLLGLESFAMRSRRLRQMTNRRQWRASFSTLPKSSGSFSGLTISGRRTPRITSLPLPSRVREGQVSRPLSPRRFRMWR